MAIEFPNPDVLMAPMKAQSERLINTTTKLVEMQSKNFEKYSKLMLDSMKEATELKDMETASSFFKKQPELTAELMKSMMEDAKELGEVSKAFLSETQEAMTSEMEKVKTEVDKAADSAAKKTDKATA
ncbi:phasin family protein [Granulosicoccaceae sp. 1_MG-2023]|nr:phasin family protein [Granulosicoccaceae sp. 1_MG-2023]